MLIGIGFYDKIGAINDENMQKKDYILYFTSKNIPL